MVDKVRAVAELQEIFSDVVNYDAEDPMEPIDPISYRTPEGDSCLHLACVRGDFHAVELLIALGLDVNGIGDLGNTPLHYAKRQGNERVVDLLIKRGADVNRENELGVVPK